MVQPWMHDDLLKKISVKDKVYVASKKAKEGSPEKAELKNTLKQLNHEISGDIVDSKANYFEGKINQYKNDMKNTWATINQIINKKRTKTKYPPFFEVGSRKITDQQEVAKEFNNYFATIGQKLADEISTDGLPQMQDYLGERPNRNSIFNPPIVTV